jgi:hypothetical protein
MVSIGLPGETAMMTHDARSLFIPNVTLTSLFVSLSLCCAATAAPTPVHSAADWSVMPSPGNDTIARAIAARHSLAIERPTVGFPASHDGTDSLVVSEADSMSWAFDIPLATGNRVIPAGPRFVRFRPYYEVETATATFAFKTPVHAYTAYLTGFGIATRSIDILITSGAISGARLSEESSGGPAFHGTLFPEDAFTSAVHRLQLSSRLRSPYDNEDMEITTPEPATIMLFALGGLALRRNRPR